jgi:hypothetical protein
VYHTKDATDLVMGSRIECSCPAVLGAVAFDQALKLKKASFIETFSIGDSGIGFLST